MSLATNLAQIPNITTGYIPRATATGFVNAMIFDNGTSVFIGNGQSSATPQTGIIEGTDGSGTNIAGAEFRIQGGQGTGTGAGGAITFYTAAAGTTGTATNTAVERMRIDTSGRVGIGTNSPNDLLEVRGGFIRLSATSGNGPQFNLYSNGQTSSHVTLAQGFALATDNIGYLYNRANADFVFGTNNAERMRISASGNVGIGTSSPNESLTIAGLNGNIRIYGRNGVAENQIASNVYYNGSAWVRDNASYGAAVVNISTLGLITFNTTAATSGYPDERMRITSSGTVGIGVTTPSSRLEVLGDMIAVGSGSSISWQDRSGSGRFSWYAPNGNFTYLYNLGNIGQFSMASGAYTALSDINKKKDFEDSTIGLNAILGLKPTLYRMKTADDNSEKELGFIAQQVKEFIPQAYMEDGEGEDKFIGLSDRPIIAALVKAIQEQQEQINSLKSQLGGN